MPRRIRPYKSLRASGRTRFDFYHGDCVEQLPMLGAASASVVVTSPPCNLGVQYRDPPNIARWQGAGSGRRCRGNTWFIPYETIQSRDRDRPHPATFPPRLPEYCVRLHGQDRTRLVVDPFLGWAAPQSRARGSASPSRASSWTSTA